MNLRKPYKPIILIAWFTAAVAVASGQNISNTTVLSDFYSAIFNVNRTEIQANDSTVILDSLLRVLKTVDKDSYILGRAAASPEGPYWNNVRLANGRRMALNNILAKHDIDTTTIQYYTVAEDYELLAEMLRQAQDPSYAMVLATIKAQNGDLKAIKRQLMDWKEGVPWRHWHKVYFPALRATRIWTISKPHPIKADFSINTQPTATLRQPLYKINVGDFDNTGDSSKPRREFLSIKSNLLGYAVYIPQYGYCPIPNWQIEYYPRHGHWTGALSLDNPWWIGNTVTHKYMEVRNWQIEGRYYLRNSDQSYSTHEAAFKGLYLQAYGHTGLYQIGFSAKKGWKGEGGGAGAGIGYVLPLTRWQHWRLEFSGQIGFLATKYDRYVYGDPWGNVLPTGNQKKDYYYDWPKGKDPALFHARRFHKVMPAPKVGISLSYDLLYRKTVKGVSFRSKNKKKK